MLDGTVAPITEPYFVQDIFACGLHDLEYLGDALYRFSLFTNQKGVGGVERVLTARIIMPEAAIVTATEMTLKKLKQGLAAN